MRDDYPRQRTSVLVWLICGVIAGFMLQLVLGSAAFGGGTAIETRFGLTISGVQAGRVWTLLTYGLLHSPHNFLHIIVNVLALYLLGRELLPLLGARRFLGLFAGALVGGALLWSAVHWRDNGILLGATAGVDALFIVFACFYPNQEFNFLLLFVLPVTLKPKHLATALVAIDVIGLLVYEIPHAPLPLGMSIASSSHLGGMAVGWLYFRFVHDAPWRRSPRADVELPRWLKRSHPAVTPPPLAETNVSTPEGVRAEVDRILDKINSHGLGSLTADEKRVLDEAKDFLSRH